MSSGYSIPEVFTDNAFQYTGTYKEIKQAIKIDLMFWQALCHSGHKTKVRDFNRAVRFMSAALKGGDFSTILDGLEGF